MGNKIIEKYYTDNVDRLRVFFMTRTACKALSEDMAQDVFVRLIGYGQMITEQTLPSLAYTVARRLLADHYRHRMAENRYAQLCAAEQVCHDDPHTVYLEREALCLLERSIMHLPEQCATVYRMHIYQGMKPARIAELTHIKYKTVEHRLGKARREVRAAMEAAAG